MHLASATIPSNPVTSCLPYSAPQASDELLSQTVVGLKAVKGMFDLILLSATVLTYAENIAIA